MADTTTQASETILSRDHVLAQATELSIEVEKKIMEGDYEIAINIAGMALEMITKA
jgi:hypothetical protein